MTAYPRPRQGLRFISSKASDMAAYPRPRQGLHRVISSKASDNGCVSAFAPRTASCYFKQG